jgi:electron transfer flavoprotein alpha subunit
MPEYAEYKIWVHCDLRNDRFFGFSLNVLAKACELARSCGGTTAAVVIGAAQAGMEQGFADMGRGISLEEGAHACISHGADTVYVIEHRDLAVPRADLFAPALADAVGRFFPRLVLFALTHFGRELAARTARLCNGGLIAECADLRLEGGKTLATCPSWGGEIMAEITFAGNEATGFATVQPNIVQAVEQPGRSGTIVAIPIDSVGVPARLRLLARRPEPDEHRRLEDAEIVVVGGAGIGSAEGFGAIRQLAAALGGEVGATRPPVLQHWVEEKRLIGQTGKTVRPRLLFSVGTSGAVQYTAGIMGAKTVVAVNRDEKAPIFRIADYGIVGDWKTVVPLLASRVKRSVMRRLTDVLCEGDKRGDRGSFGTRLCRLRQDMGWSIEALAQATDQSPEYVAQVEKDEIAPPVSFMLRLARALGVDPGTFLRDEEKVAIRDQRTQAFIKRTQNYSYQTLTPDAEIEHLRAFLVTIEPRQVHTPVAYKHEGEEFVYVLEGELQLTVGGKPYHLKPRESMRFNSDIPHKLMSLSDQDTQCLVVLYTP